MERKPTPQGDSRGASAFPSEEKLAHWTMRNNSQEFDAEQALATYKKSEAEFDASTDEFISNF